jgi:hypothetical protein
MPFQPSSAFGQQMAATISGSSYGYLNGQSNGQPQNTGYNPVQQQLQSSSYVAQFDPYSAIGQGWDGGNGSSMGAGQAQGQQMMGGPQGGYQQQNMTSPAYSTSISASGQQHPRDYLRTHKAEIEAWDSFAWKQLLNACNNLKDTWEGRVRELNGQIGQYQAQLQFGNVGYYAGQIQQEKVRLEGVRFILCVIYNTKLISLL